jgi:hypothetical protein
MVLERVTMYDPRAIGWGSVVCRESVVKPFGSTLKKVK